MRSATFSRKSWHYRLASVYSDGNDYNMRNICSYTRKVLKGLILAAFIVGLFSFISFPFGGVVLYIVACLQTGLWFNPFDYTSHMDKIIDVWVLFISIYIFVGTIMGIVYGVYFCFRSIRKTTPMPSAVSEMYEAFHDKTCFRVNLE